MKIASFAPFRHRPFALFWSGAFVSNIGTWMETVAIGIYVTDKTGLSTWTGIVAAAGFLPTAVLGPVGGALADRYPRRLILLSTSLVQTVLAGFLTALAIAGEPAPLTVTLVVFGSGIASSIGFPAYQALLPDLVPPDDLPGAIGLSSAQWNLGRVIGPLLAGVIIHVGGLAWALGVNTVSFLAVIGVLAVLSLPAPHPDGHERILAAIRSGVRYAWREPGQRIVLESMALVTLLAAPFIALMPAMSIKVLHEGAIGTSVLVTAQGVGAVTMGLSMGGLGRRYGQRRVLTAMLTGLTPALLLYAFAPVLSLSAAAVFLLGALYLGTFSSFTTITQLRAPKYLRGRVISVNLVILGAVYPAASVAQGAIADRVGLRATTAGAALLMAGVLLFVRLRDPGRTAVLDMPAETSGR
ncbi:MAG: MFS transporter [Acidimicrobiia bacterium]|nr:MFS transporter [Acidimicrobiia bacterium]